MVHATVRRHLSLRSFPTSPARRISPLKLSPRREGTDGDHLGLPSPRSTLQHACPVVLEAVVGPLALFYVVLVLTGFRALSWRRSTWSYLALARRVRRGERISTMLLLGTALLTARTAISFITGSAIVYFAQPMATAVVAAFVLIGSAALGRPLTQRFVHDFCPIDPELLARPRVRQFFVRISLLWATVLMVNAGLTLWLLLSSSLRHVRARTDGGHLGADGPGHLPVDHVVRGFHAQGRHHCRVESVPPASAHSSSRSTEPGDWYDPCFPFLELFFSACSRPRSPYW